MVYLGPIPPLSPQELEELSKPKNGWIKGYGRWDTRARKTHYVNGFIHNDDGPAVIYEDGSKEWYKNGLRHRDNGKPALVNGNRKEWWLDDRLHREDGPAIEHTFYVFKFIPITRHQYFLRNVLLSGYEYLQCLKNEITIEQIKGEDNIEKRRLFIEYYGLEKYIQDSDSKVISQDKYGILYKKEQFRDQDLVMVRVRNSTPESDGSYKFYFIRVPPDISSAKAAVAWTFGMREEEYSPDIES